MARVALSAGANQSALMRCPSALLAAVVVNARALAGKKRVARKAGHDVRRLRLRRLPRKRFRLRVVAKLASGESVTGSRRYKPCG
jgi:hypothetical protein